jgi:hypothetical protein
MLTAPKPLEAHAFEGRQIMVRAPYVGEVLTVHTHTGDRLHFSFNLEKARVEMTAKDMVIAIPSGGQVILPNFATRLHSGEKIRISAQGHERMSVEHLLQSSARLITEKEESDAPSPLLKLPEEALDLSARMQRETQEALNAVRHESLAMTFSRQEEPPTDDQKIPTPCFVERRARPHNEKTGWYGRAADAAAFPAATTMPAPLEENYLPSFAERRRAATMLSNDAQAMETLTEEAERKYHTAWREAPVQTLPAEEKNVTSSEQDGIAGGTSEDHLVELLAAIEVPPSSSSGANEPKAAWQTQAASVSYLVTGMGFSSIVTGKNVIEPEYSLAPDDEDEAPEKEFAQEFGQELEQLEQENVASLGDDLWAVHEHNAPSMLEKQNPFLKPNNTERRPQQARAYAYDSIQCVGFNGLLSRA